MNYYPSNFCQSLSRHELSQSTSLSRPIVPPRSNVYHANPQTSIRHDERAIFSKRGLAVISYAISAGISGGIWLGIFRTAEHFLK
jgi:hypothetical protein